MLQRVKASIAARSSRLILRGLQSIYGFQPWHARNPAACRPYKAFVAELVNDLRPETVVEVGCGTGDIIAMIKAPDRLGLDPDRAVIRAARLIHPRTRFDVGGLESVRGKVDVLLCIGWLHVLDEAGLHRLMEPLIPRCRFIVVDRFVGQPGHDFGFLGQLVSASRPLGDRVREYLVHKTRP